MIWLALTAGDHATLRHTSRRILHRRVMVELYRQHDREHQIRDKHQRRKPSQVPQQIPSLPRALLRVRGMPFHNHFVRRHVG
jgi:hypothetical protein